MTDELGGKVMKQFFGLKWKRYRHLKNNNDENKKSKRQKKVRHKQNQIWRLYKLLEAAEFKKKIIYIKFWRICKT